MALDAAVPRSTRRGAQPARSGRIGAARDLARPRHGTARCLGPSRLAGSFVAYPLCMRRESHPRPVCVNTPRVPRVRESSPNVRCLCISVAQGVSESRS
jgi:hypothetical protein